MTFAELGLSPKLLEAIEAAGYTEPTPIQAGAIPPALAGRDVLGIAQTGTGKTASFTLPLIERLSRGRECVSSLAKPARCFARAPRRPRQVPWARARGVTRIAARIPNASRAGVGARSRFSPRLRIIVLC